MQGIATLPYEVQEQPFIPTGGLETMKSAAEMLADFGRNGDTYIVHAAEGETMVPMEVLDENPRLKQMLFNQMEDMGIEPERYIVGSELNSINPITGQPEFFFKKIFKKIGRGLKKVVKKIAPVVLPIANVAAKDLAGSNVNILDIVACLSTSEFSLSFISIVSAATGFVLIVAKCTRLLVSEVTAIVGTALVPATVIPYKPVTLVTVPTVGVVHVFATFTPPPDVNT